MKNIKFLALVCAISTSLFLYGCSDKKDANANKGNNQSTQVCQTENKDSEKSEEVSMADWAGEWNNMGGYLERPEVQDAYKTLGEKENMSADEAKSMYLEKRACEFDGLKIEGDKVTFLSTFPSDNGEAKGEGTYKFVEAKEVQHGNATLSWNVFEAENDDAPYKFLLMMPIHGEESLTHFHMRYGNDKDELFAKEKWYPTFVKPNTTNDQIIEEITE